MFSDLILIHRGGSTAAAFFARSLDMPAINGVVDARLIESFTWKTCLRQVVLCSSDAYNVLAPTITIDDEIYEGSEAYRFLLQTICGLQSPLVGETEVSGQFKNAVTAFSAPATPWGNQIRKVFQVLFEDAKKIRQNHLVDLGSQSYGSVIRREMKQMHEIHILGAGHLVGEMLPWLAKDTLQDGGRVHIHCRSPEKARIELKAQIEGNPGIELHAIEEASAVLRTAEALIIAAPVTSEWTIQWLAKSGASERLALIADTRGDSTEDAIADLLLDTAHLHASADDVRVVTLAHLLERISSNLARVSARKEQALIAIDQAVLERERYVEYRPFGWEDVCA